MRKETFVRAQGYTQYVMVSNREKLHRAPLRGLRADSGWLKHRDGGEHLLSHVFE